MPMPFQCFIGSSTESGDSQEMIREKEPFDIRVVKFTMHRVLTRVQAASVAPCRETQDIIYGYTPWYVQSADCRRADCIV